MTLSDAIDALERNVTFLHSTTNDLVTSEATLNATITAFFTHFRSALNILLASLAVLDLKLQTLATQNVAQFNAFRLQLVSVLHDLNGLTTSLATLNSLLVTNFQSLQASLNSLLTSLSQLTTSLTSLGVAKDLTVSIASAQLVKMQLDQLASAIVLLVAKLGGGRTPGNPPVRNKLPLCVAELLSQLAPFTL